MERWKVLAIKEMGYLIALIVEGLIDDPAILTQKLRQIAFQVERFVKKK